MNTIANVSILSAGTWGTALASALAGAGHNVTLWTSSESKAREMSESGSHPKLKGLRIAESLNITSCMEKTADADIVIIATPSVGVRDICGRFKEYYRNQIITCVSKGLEAGTLFTMSEIISDVLPGADVVALSGPTHAEEVAKDIPTLIVAASKNADMARRVQEIFVGTCIRPYTNEDIKGVEICGALKNIIALSCGMAKGLGYGDNTTAAIITRGLAEIGRLGMKMGCRRETFSGLAGMGDLIVTATSTHSRNFNAGYYMGQGMSPEEATEKVGMVVEGINALPGAMALSEKYGAELPIISSVNAIVNGEVSPKSAVDRLLERKIGSEIRNHQENKAQ